MFQPQIRVNLLHPFASINSWLQHSLPSPPPALAIPQAFEDEFFQIATHTRAKAVPKCFAQLPDLMAFFFFNKR